MGDSKALKLNKYQFKFAIKDKQWVTVKNRIINQLKWGPNIKEIKT